MIGCDIRSMNTPTRGILLNQAAIAVNQDSLGRQGYRVGRWIHAEEPAETRAFTAQVFRRG
ncbi:MAG: hypothetical protein JXN59_03015, partial [Anaerolineae bacterium]|nr:hypothetical protein [Anaerolineae bacterium]